MRMSSFDTLRVAIEKQSGPAQGIIAFLSWVLANTGIKYVLVARAIERKEYTPSWYKDHGYSWKDYNGTVWQKEASDTVIESIWSSSEDFMSLDWKKTWMYAVDGESGWLSPEGIFWGCQYGGHVHLARYVIHRDYSEMEKAGWCHVDHAGGPRKYSFRMNGDPTPAQEAWLISHGHDLDPSGKKARKQVEDEIVLAGIRINKAADAAAYERMMARAPSNSFRDFSKRGRGSNTPIDDYRVLKY